MSTFTSLAIMAAAAIVASGNSAPAQPAPHGVPPVTLLAQPSGDGVDLKVIGNSPEAIAATYTLEASGGPRGATNKSVQRGTVQLAPGVPVSLITVHLGNVVGGSWVAKLTVSLADGKEYEVTKRSGAES